MGEVILYHGSKEIIRHPEIRTAKYNKVFIQNGHLRHYNL